MAEEFQRRTPETHSQHCESLLGALCNHYQTTYGVMFDSVLNQSHYFHVTNGLVPDAMHDLLEGCVPYEVKEMLKVMIDTNSYFNLDEVNTRVANFPYADPERRDKPSDIPSSVLYSHDHRLNQEGMYACSK